MDLKYRYAVVRFCDDLTDPRATSVPAGILLLGSIGDQHIGGVVGSVQTHPPLDEVTAAILQDVPRLLREHVDAVHRESGSTDPAELLASLAHALRGSLHVGSISDEATVHLDRVSPELSELLLTIFVDQLEKVFERVEVTPVEKHPTRKMSPRERALRSPSQVFYLS